jgi:hypothetical protein
MGELSYEFLHNLHHEQANDEESYIQQMSKICNRGWVVSRFYSNMLGIKKYIMFNSCMNKNNGQIMMNKR